MFAMATISRQRNLKLVKGNLLGLLDMNRRAPKEPSRIPSQNSEFTNYLQILYTTGLEKCNELVLGDMLY